MSRTQSQGISYFPFAVDFFSDNKVKILKARYGNDGVAIYIYLLCCIYREGYYTRVNEDLEFIISDDLGISLGTVQQVMTFLLKRSMFDDKLFKSDNILTSDGIQERWQDAIKTRAAKRPIEVGKYWLLRKDRTIPHIKCTLFEPNSENNDLNSENNDLNSENYRNKVKESKVNNIHTPPISPKVEWEDYEVVLSILKEACPIIYNRHAKRINEKSDISVAGEVNKALDEILQVYSLEELKAIFENLNQTYMVKPKYSYIDLAWVLNNTVRVHKAIKEVEGQENKGLQYEVDEDGVVIGTIEEKQPRTKSIKQSKQEQRKAQDDMIMRVLARNWQEGVDELKERGEWREDEQG